MGNRPNILDAVERMNSTIDKVDDFDELNLELSERILDNRIITLEGYLRYLDSEGIPKMKRILDKLEDDEIDWSDLL